MTDDDSSGGEDEDRCQYCGSVETVEVAYHTMCESCHEAFLSGQEKGRHLEQKMSGGVRGDGFGS